MKSNTLIKTWVLLLGISGLFSEVVTKNLTCTNCGSTGRVGPEENDCLEMFDSCF